MSRIKLAIVGLGKIARDQHIPACTANDNFELVAIASPHDRLDGVQSFPSIVELLEAVPDVTAVALCTPPQVRYETARYALERGRHVLLEKPPGVTVGEIQDLAEHALYRGVSLFAAWHCRHDNSGIHFLRQPKDPIRPACRIQAEQSSVRECDIHIVGSLIHSQVNRAAWYLPKDTAG